MNDSALVLMAALAGALGAVLVLSVSLLVRWLRERGARRAAGSAALVGEQIALLAQLDEKRDEEIATLERRLAAVENKQARLATAVDQLSVNKVDG